MNRSICLFGALLAIASSVHIRAQDSQTAASEVMGGMRRRTLVINIDARVLDASAPEEKHEVVWNETHRKITIPGSPVGIKLVGSNVIVAVQFTPFIRRHGNVLVAQGQIWYNDPDKGISYYTSIQTIPLEFDEPIYFFPLGTVGEPFGLGGDGQQLDSSIEIVLTISPNTAAPAAETAANMEDD